MDTVKLQGEGGSVFEYDLPLDPYIQQRLDLGRMRQLDDGPALVVEAHRPAQSAPKSDWVAWAVQVHGLAADDAEAMTKADLIELPDVEPDEYGEA